MDNKGEILVVDDTRENLRLLTDMLVAEGYKVRPTQEPKLALDSALVSPPDLILLDVKMPGMDGIQLLREVREHDLYVPVVLITAYGTIERAVEAIAVLGVIAWWSRRKGPGR